MTWNRGGSAAPAVAGLAAYLMSLDQSRAERHLVPGSVARNVRDLIKSLAYARRPLQPAVVWNGIDSTQVQCPVRRDVGPSGCPARNMTSVTSPKVPPGHRTIPSQSPKVMTSRFNSPSITSVIASSITVPFNPPSLPTETVSITVQAAPSPSLIAPLTTAKH